MNKSCAGKAVRQPNEHRLLAAIERQRIKGMSAATARVWQMLSWREYERRSMSAKLTF